MDPNKKHDHVYREHELDLSFYDNNVGPPVENAVLPIELEKKLAKSDVINRYNAVLRMVKIERF